MTEAYQEAEEVGGGDCSDVDLATGHPSLDRMLMGLREGRARGPGCPPGSR